MQVKVRKEGKQAAIAHEALLWGMLEQTMGKAGDRKERLSGRAGRLLGKCIAYFRL